MIIKKIKIIAIIAHLTIIKNKKIKINIKLIKKKTIVIIN